MKIPNRRELQQIVINYSRDTDFEELEKFYKKCFLEPCSYLVMDTILPSGNLFTFSKTYVGISIVSNHDNQG